MLDEYERWTGDAALVRRFEPEARAALEWIDHYGDLDGDGYVEYQRRNTKTGLDNQCWKDSHTSIVDRHGALASAPRAVSEVQGYVYDAKIRCARLAREVWEDEELAARLEQEAAELKDRFNRDFWVEELDCFALALDGEKRQMDSIASNIGHLLWSGIVDEDKAQSVVRHLLGPGLYSGWGVRTMSADEVTYNPIGYHLGTVWPHDNSLIVAGLARYGYREEAAQIAAALLEAATYFDGRLPEAFAGYPREETRFPVEYPTACSPQAWASGTPLLLDPGDARPRAGGRLPRIRSASAVPDREALAERDPWSLGPGGLRGYGRRSPLRARRRRAERLLRLAPVGPRPRARRQRERKRDDPVRRQRLRAVACQPVRRDE